MPPVTWGIMYGCCVPCIPDDVALPSLDGDAMSAGSFKPQAIFILALNSRTSPSFARVPDKAVAKINPDSDLV